MIVTIDGPAGSGKSTAARGLAEALGIAFLDTGATYRAATLKALREDVDLANEAALVATVRSADIRLEPTAAGVRVLLDGEDVSDAIRRDEVSENSHFIARSPAAREVLVALQRRIGESLGSFVAEGRDQGSVVFPEADVKFYLDASPKVRARRRTQELTEREEKVNEFDVLAAIERRDQRDRTRSVAPLVQPEGAIVVDTSDLTVEQMVETLLRHVETAP